MDAVTVWLQGVWMEQWFSGGVFAATVQQYIHRGVFGCGFGGLVKKAVLASFVPKVSRKRIGRKEKKRKE